MDENGRVTTWINQRGSDKGMVPRWLEAGVTHLGMGTNIGSDRHQVVFGRIFGDNGRADVSIETSPSSSQEPQGRVPSPGTDDADLRAVVRALLGNV